MSLRGCELFVAWRDDPELLRRWQQGSTGVPFVDAGMRELWRTGTMHNRLRMVTASFLTKNLLIHWLRGARWFWDCLIHLQNGVRCQVTSPSASAAVELKLPVMRSPPRATRSWKCVNSRSGPSSTMCSATRFVEKMFLSA